MKHTSYFLILERIVLESCDIGLDGYEGMPQGNIRYNADRAGYPCEYAQFTIEEFHEKGLISPTSAKLLSGNLVTFWKLTEKGKEYYITRFKGFSGDSPETDDSIINQRGKTAYKYLSSEAEAQKDEPKS